MKTITLGQLKQLHAAGELGSFNSRIDFVLIDNRKNSDDTEINFEIDMLWLKTDKQRDLLTQWGFIEPKFKEGDYIIHPEVGFCKIRTIIGNAIEYVYEGSTLVCSMHIESGNCKNSRLATPEEIEANTLIKLEVGSYIVDHFGKTNQIVSVDSRGYVEVKRKEGWNTAFWIGSDFHKKAKLATPEQIKAFNTVWNEGIEEARKYKDGQPCLVNCLNNPGGWFLRYADGNGFFYDACKKSGKTIITWDRHMPLNETTIKNLPVNE